MFITSLKNASLAIRDHLWTAWDIAKASSWHSAPQLVDLLAQGRRQGFNESPDSLYSLGFINIQQGSEWKITIPDIDAFYTVVSLHSKNNQSSFEWLSDKVKNERTITLSDNVSSQQGINTTDFKGLCQLMVRQYFTYPVDSVNLPLPTITKTPEIGHKKRIYYFPASVIAGMKFLLWRLKPLIAVKFLQYRLGNKLPRNTFLSFDDIVELWKGGNEMVTRMGVNKFRYLFCYYDIPENHYMKINYNSKGSHYFAFALNHTWVQRIKHDQHTTHANSFQLQNTNDQFDIFVTLQPESHDNNLCTLGNTKGIIGFREIFPGSNPEKPECLVTSK